MLGFPLSTLMYNESLAHFPSHRMFHCRDYLQENTLIWTGKVKRSNLEREKVEHVHHSLKSHRGRYFGNQCVRAVDNNDNTIRIG